MKVCGVDLKSNEANVCLLSLVDGMFHIPDCRTRRLTLADTVLFDGKCNDAEWQFGR